ncbi:MAG: TIGR00159 family protein [Oligoflexales bacterium]|nr:TIGR00159 family protein [Oligoflexales bacterium]
MREILEQFGWWSAIDILLIAVFFYYVLLLVKGTRTAQMLTGVLVVVAVFLVSSVVPLTTVNWVMNKFYSSIILILIILFQDDVRHALSKIGKRSFMAANEHVASLHILDEVTRASIALAKNRIGALIVMERNIILSRYVDIGTLVDARISKELLMSIFHTSSPLHDGAVIIQQGRVSAAGCFLPLTREDNLTKDWGTRHRAAIGISQETDAVVILVSEEKGEVSLVYDGKVIPMADKEEIRKLLQRHLVDEPEYAKNSEKQLRSSSLFERVSSINGRKKS